jgi:hypothetical protein
MHRAHLAGCVDDRAALRFGCGDGEKPVAQALVEIPVEPLEPVGRAGAARGTGEAVGDGQVEDQRQVGLEIAERKTLQRRQLGERQTAAVPLIGDRRIGKAVADDPPSRRERRLDQPRDVIASRRVEQQRLADRVPALGLALQQQAADQLGSRRTAGLARRLRGAAGARQRRDEERDLGRFPGPLPAFDGDEPAARGQWRPPQIR